MAGLRVLPQVGNPVFLVCSLWGIWAQVVFGVWFWMCTIIFRLWKLFVIVKLKRSTHGFLFYLSFLIFWGPGVVYGIVTSAFQADGPLDYEGHYQCLLTDPAMYSLFAIIGLYVFVVIVFFISLILIVILIFFINEKNRVSSLPFDQFHAITLMNIEKLGIF